MDWHKVTITAKEAAQGRHVKILDDIARIFTQLGSNKELALFTSDDSDGASNIYFTPTCYEIPALKDLIESNDGQMCEEPADRELKLFAEAGGDWRHLIRPRRN